ncbi:MAG: LPS export ABC transporter permease LptF [Methylotenera sp.]|nr:LPS export ABC transporter permease LptF [Methylotenera sp.]
MLFKRSLKQELILALAGAILILLGIVLAQRAASIVRLAAKGILPNDAITTLLGLNLMMYLPMILSLALFLAVLMTLSRWYRDSEMTIWFSAGMSITHWIRPVLSVAIPLMVIIACLSLFLTPWSVQKSENFRTELKSRDELSTISPGVFKETQNGERVYFIESFDALGNVVKNVFIQTIQHQKLGIIVASEGSRVTEKNGDHFLVLENGRRYQGARNTAEYATTEFERYAVRVEAKEVKQEDPSTQSVSSATLLKEKTPSNKAELQWRLAMPISALLLALLAIPLSAIDPRAGRTANFALALLVYIVYTNLLSIMQAWIVQGKVSPTIGLWPVHGLFLLIIIYMFYRRTKQLPLLPSFNLVRKV